MKKSYELRGMVSLMLLTIGLFIVKADEPAPVVIGGIAYILDEEASTAETAALPNEEKYVGELTIPETVSSGGKEYKVVKIGNNSLRDAPSLTSVKLSEGLEVIGNSSFANCSAITSITLPSSVVSIEDWAFYGCAKLESINIPDGITAITEHTFQNSGLKSILLPESVTSVKTCAFQDATGLASINLEKVTEIGNWSLYGTAITEAVIGNVFKIGDASFQYCALLTHLTFTGTVVTIADWAFNATGLSSVVLPSTLMNLGVGSFSDSPNLKQVTIPPSVKLLKEWTFSSTDMEEIHVSWDNLTGVTVNENAFANVTGTPEWFVPANLKEIYGETWNGFPVSVASSSESLKQENVKVYYSDGRLNMIGVSGVSAMIYSLDGRRIEQIKMNGISTGLPVSLPSGVYFLTVTNEAGIGSGYKFIVR